jgi:hypothetical protein
LDNCVTMDAAQAERTNLLKDYTMDETTSNSDQLEPHGDIFAFMTTENPADLKRAI